MHSIRHRDDDWEAATFPPSISDNCITPAELAAWLNISLRTLREWHRLRMAPPRITVGKLRLYRKSAVEAWLAARETTAPRRHRV